LDGARLRKATAEAQVAEIEAAEALKSVADVGYMVERCSALFTAMRTRLAAVGPKVAGRAASMKNPAQIQELVDQEIRESLKTLDVSNVLGPVAPTK